MTTIRHGSLIGYGFLRESLRLPLPPLLHVARRESVAAIEHTPEGLRVPPSVAPKGDDILSHVQFALKHEGTDLAVLKLALPHLDTRSFLAELRAAPGSGYLRLTGYLYEAFTGETLDDLPGVRGSYVDLFDSNRYYTCAGDKNSRWRVRFNGLGSLRYCPMVRKTERIGALAAMDILGQANAFYASTDPGILDRALSWAYLSETEGSFALERESPQSDKKDRFVALLRQAHDPRPMSEDYLVELQNSTVSNPFDQAVQYRTEQNWLRTKGLRGPAGVSYVPPAPDDAAAMMSDLLELLNRKPSDIDPIMLGALISFGFVFIHPFMDGNGRLSRFLMHYALSQSGRLAEGLMLPISVAMKRDERDYLAALQSFSRPTRALWHVRMIDEVRFACESTAGDAMYRYWDATRCVEFIYEMALNALKTDLVDETRYLQAFDQAYRLVNEHHDIRDHDLNNLIMWCAQNGGHVSKKRREQLGHRYRADVFDAVETAVRQAWADLPGARD